MRSYVFILLSLFFISCQKESAGIFHFGSQIYSPVMVSPAMLSYSGCQKLDDLESVREEIERARAAHDDFHVLQETPEMIVVGYSENAARYFFKDKASCQAYTDNLSQLGWKKK